MSILPSFSDCTRRSFPLTSYLSNFGGRVPLAILSSFIFRVARVLSNLHVGISGASIFFRTELNYDPGREGGDGYIGKRRGSYISAASTPSLTTKYWLVVVVWDLQDVHTRAPFWNPKSKSRGKKNLVKSTPRKGVCTAQNSNGYETFGNNGCICRRTSLDLLFRKVLRLSHKSSYNLFEKSD